MGTGSSMQMSVVDACRAVTAALGGIPWAVLSGGVDHETFLGHLQVALDGGASGAIAGRSVWKDCLYGDRARTAQALRERGVPLMTAPPETYYEMLEERLPGHGQPVGEIGRAHV